MKPDVPRISEAEWEVMKVVWDEAPVTAQRIVERLGAAGHNDHPKTVRTLIGRLVRKGALGFEAGGRAYRYRPLVDEPSCVAEVSASFLDRVFGGSLNPLVAHFVERRRLSEEERRELLALLEKAGRRE